MVKYRIYIDEVGNPDLKSSNLTDHRYLCLAGVIIELGYVRDVVQPELDALKKEFFHSDPDEPVILHRKEILYKKGPFYPLKEKETEKKFNDRFLALLDKWEFTVIGVVIDKQEHNDRYSTWKYDPYHYCQEIMLERYRLFLNIKKAIGDVMIESRGGAEDMRLKKSFRNLMEKGTHNINPEQLKEHLTSLELKVKTKQSNIAGLQLADLLAHPVRRWAFMNLMDMGEDKQTFADQINEILEKKKLFRYRDMIKGFGIKKLP
jgi:hypothetical protein